MMKISDNLVTEHFCLALPTHWQDMWVGKEIDFNSSKNIKQTAVINITGQRML